MTLVSVQPFGLDAPGGGSRILRSLYESSPIPVLSVVTGRTVPPTSAQWTELHLPLRPGLGPIEGSRYDHWAHALEVLLSSGARRRIARVCVQTQAAAVHAVAHSPSFWPALGAARSLGLPYLLSVHDDLRYLLRGSPIRPVALRRLGQAWRQADERFVISRALGEEYCNRYGRASYTIITDGLTESDFLDRRASTPRDLRCYFGGLFHRGYRANLDSFVRALELLGGQRPDLQPSLTCRCGSLPEPLNADVPVSVLPFGAQSLVREDISRSDLLYLPLMFEPEYRDMVAFSLSTKLVTYLASGIPILYHGPPNGAAYELLAANDAAILATSSDPAAVCAAISAGLERAGELAANARELARREFMLEYQRARFWRPLAAAAAA